MFSKQCQHYNGVTNLLSQGVQGNELTPFPVSRLTNQWLDVFHTVSPLWGNQSSVPWGTKKWTNPLPCQYTHQSATPCFINMVTNLLPQGNNSINWPRYLPISDWCFPPLCYYEKMWLPIFCLEGGEGGVGGRGQGNLTLLFCLNTHVNQTLSPGGDKKIKLPPFTVSTLNNLLATWCYPTQWVLIKYWHGNSLVVQGEETTGWINPFPKYTHNKKIRVLQHGVNIDMAANHLSRWGEGGNRLNWHPINNLMFLTQFQ